MYAKYGEEIEQLAEAETPLDDIRAKFTDFEELDGEYYETADEDMAAAVAYVQANWDKFAIIED